MHFVVQNPKSVPAPQRLGNSTKASTLKLPGYPTSHKLHFENSPLTLFPPSSSIPSTSRLAVLKAGGWLMGRPLATSKPRICAEAEHHRLLTLPRSHAGCLRSDLAGLEFGAPSGACMAGSRSIRGISAKVPAGQRANRHPSNKTAQVRRRCVRRRLLLQQVCRGCSRPMLRVQTNFRPGASQHFLHNKTVSSENVWLLRHNEKQDHLLWMSTSASDEVAVPEVKVNQTKECSHSPLSSLKFK